MEGSARLLCLGERTLTEGFALIGFEVWPDAARADLDRLLAELQREGQAAFLLIDQALAASGSERLARVQREGGRILVAELPPVNAPGRFHIDIDDQVSALLGGVDLNREE